MTERVFLDTNILVYLFDRDAPAKQRAVREFLTSLPTADAVVISTQVLQEFYVTVTRKLAVPVKPATAAQAVYDLSTWPVVQVDPSLILLAIARSQSERLSFWDALIVEAALAGEAPHLYSEDLQDGRTLDGLTVVNPFRHGFASQKKRDN